MKRIWKWALALIAILIFIGFTWNFWVTESELVYVHYAVWNRPALDIVPVDRALSTGGSVSGQTYSFDGITFQTPWSTTPNKRVGSSYFILNFVTPAQGTSTSPAVFILPPGATTSEMARLRMDFAKYRDPLFSSMKTNYDLANTALGITRVDIGLFKPLSHSVPSAIILVYKSIWSATSPSLQTYRIHNDHGIRGFEMPQSATTSEFVLFTPSDEEVDLFVAKATQEQRDAVIQSVRVAP